MIFDFVPLFLLYIYIYIVTSVFGLFLFVPRGTSCARYPAAPAAAAATGLNDM